MKSGSWNKEKPGKKLRIREFISRGDRVTAHHAGPCSYQAHGRSRRCPTSRATSMLGQGRCASPRRSVGRILAVLHDRPYDAHRRGTRRERGRSLECPQGRPKKATRSLDGQRFKVHFQARNNLELIPPQTGAQLARMSRNIATGPLLRAIHRGRSGGSSAFRSIFTGSWLL